MASTKYLILIRGPPAVGKTAIGAKLVKVLPEPAIVLHQETIQYRLPSSGMINFKTLINAMVRNLLAQNASIIIDGDYSGEAAKEQIDILANIAKRNAAKFTHVFIDAPLDTCLARNKDRSKKAPDEEIRKQYDSAHTSMETAEVIDSTKHTVDQIVAHIANQLTK